jgi:hypothetical protein
VLQGEIEQSVKVGLVLVRANWKQTDHQYRDRYNNAEPPMNPYATDYDLHVNGAHGKVSPLHLVCIERISS